MTTLYFSPGAASMAPHIVLYELAIPHDVVRVSTGDEEHTKAEYLAINPVARVPALRVDGGDVLTEVPAILVYLSELAGGALMPTGALARAQVHRWLSFIASEAHPAAGLVVRPTRLHPDGDSAELNMIRGRGRALFLKNLLHLEDRFVGPFALGETLSVIDPYLFVLMNWAVFMGLEREGLPKLRGLVKQMLPRPSVLKTLRAEGLIDDMGRPTPPTRV